MLNNQELKIIYCSLLKQYECTSQQISQFTSLLSRCQEDKFECLADEVELRLLALSSQASDESDLLSKVFKLWKGGRLYGKTENEKKN